MIEYHVGCGITAIFAGVLDSNTESNKLWLQKSDVTDEAFVAVAQYSIEHNQSLIFEYKGKKYKLSVKEVK